MLFGYCRGSGRSLRTQRPPDCQESSLACPWTHSLRLYGLPLLHQYGAPSGSVPSRTDYSALRSERLIRSAKCDTAFNMTNVLSWRRGYLYMPVTPESYTHINSTRTNLVNKLPRSVLNISPIPSSHLYLLSVTHHSTSTD